MNDRSLTSSLKKHSVLLILSFMVFSVSAKEEEPDWLPISNENLLLLEFETGTVTILLAPEFAPEHVKQVKALVKEGFYQDLTLYRVIENFVVQGGDPKSEKQSAHRKPLQSEFERTISNKAVFTLVQAPDLLAQQTRFINGFAVGRDLKDNKEWLLHCPGAINIARSNDPNSGTTDFAIMFGQAPRHLDRNMSIFGKVIDGWEALYKVNRGDVKPQGIFSDENQRTKILDAKMASSLPIEEQKFFEMENTASASFKKYINQMKVRENAFFSYKGNGNVDICYNKPLVRIKKPL